MRKTATYILLLTLIAFNGYAQSVELKAGKVYKGNTPIFALAPLKDGRTGFSLQTLKGEKLIAIYQSNIDQGDDVGYIVKFLDDNMSFTMFRKPNDNLFFQNIIQDLVTTGALKGQHIDPAGKSAYLQKHEVSQKTCKSGYYINY
jgi:hypothetical protein